MHDVIFLTPVWDTFDAIQVFCGKFGKYHAMNKVWYD